MIVARRVRRRSTSSGGSGGLPVSCWSMVVISSRQAVALSGVSATLRQSSGWQLPQVRPLVVPVVARPCRHSALVVVVTRR